MLMIKNMLKSKFEFIKSKVFVVFILALVIRFFYVFLDYPFVFHPDEPTVVNSTINLRYSPNPKHFDWPTFYYYLNFPLYFIFEKVYFVLVDVGLYNSLVIDSFNYYLISRILTIFFGAGTVITTYYILKNLNLDDNLSIIGSAIMAIIPFHVTRSAQALTDVPMVFFASLVLLYLSSMLEKFKPNHFLLACFFAGLSVSTKYNGYMIFLSLILFILFFRGIKLIDFSLYLKSAGVSFLGFFIGTPYSVFDYKTFFISDSPKGALWQFTNVGRVGIRDQIVNFFENLFINNYALMGYIPIIASILFIIIFIWKKDFLNSDSKNKFILILILQLIFIFWSVSGVKIQRAHYLILVYLFLPLFTVLLIERFKEKILFKYTILFMTLVLATYSLYIRFGEVAIIKFYERVRISGNPKDLYVIYNSIEAKLVLDKLKIPNEKITAANQQKLISSSRTTHAIVKSDICLNKADCDFELIERIDSRSDSEVVYVFKKK